MSSQRSFMLKKKGYRSVSEIGPSSLKVDADGQVGISKAPLPIGTAEPKRLHQKDTRSTGSVGKWRESHYRELQIRERARSWLPGGSWAGWNPYPGPPPTTRRLAVLRSQSKYFCFVWGSFITDHRPGSTKSPFVTCRARGVYYFPDSPRVAL